MANPDVDGVNGNQNAFPPQPPMDGASPQQQIIFTCVFLICMLAIFGIVTSFVHLRRRAHFRNITDSTDTHDSVLIPSRIVDVIGGRFMTLTERRRREEIILKNSPSVISLPIKTLHQDELMAWDKLQPVCAQFEDTEDDDGMCEMMRRASSSNSCESRGSAGVMVGTIIMMPTATPKHGRGQFPVSHLEMMLGTSRAREI